MHVRQSIRQAVVTAVTGLTTTSSRVFDSRILPQSASDLPCLRVYATTETSEEATLVNLARVCQIVVQGVARATSEVEDTLDTIAEEVETAIAGAAGITSAGAKEIHIVSTELEFEADGDNPHGMVTLTFAALYHTARATPGTAI